jgi:amino acid transporter
MNREVIAGEVIDGEIQKKIREGSPGFTLIRKLNWIRSGAMNYSIAGPSAGIFSLFGFALIAAGPAFFWGWPIICLAVGAICLVYAELASHYPYAGVMYQWPTILIGRRGGWLIGWLYLFALMVLLASIYFILPLAIIPLFGWHATTSLALIISGIALLIATITNVAGIDLLGRFTGFGVLAELIIAVGVSTALLIFGHHQSPSVLMQTSGLGFGKWLPGFTTGGLFIAIWVMFGFETGGTLGEETIDAKKQAPKAILWSYAIAAAIGLYTIFSFLIATPNFKGAEQSASPLVYIINYSLPHFVSKVFLVLIAEITILAANVAFTGVARQVLGMAREQQLPASKYLSITRNGTPWVAILVVAAFTALPFVATQQFAVLATGATGAIYFSYFLVMCSVLFARFRGWPRTSAPFSLGRWGFAVNVLAVLVTGGILVDLLWVRPTTNPAWKLGLPVAYWIVGLPFLVGVLYYAFFQHRRISEQMRAEATEAEGYSPATGLDVATLGVQPDLSGS